MKRVILIRHGQQNRGKDEGLTDVGKQQAEITGKYLAQRAAREGGIAAIHTSDLRRAAETTDEIRYAFGNAPIITDPRLRERMNWGDIDPDEPFEDFSRLWQQTLHERDLKPHGRESAIESGQRLDEYIQSLPDSEHPYVIVSHGGLFAELLQNRFSMDEIGAAMPHFPQIGERGWKGFSHCSLSELTVDDTGRYQIEGLNFTGHLEKGIGEGIQTSGHQEEGSQQGSLGNKEGGF